GRVADIPVGIFRAKVAEVYGQMRQQLLHIFPLAMPDREPLHGKGMTKGMQRRSALARDSYDAGALQKPGEYQMLRVIVETTAIAVDKERLDLPAMQYL